MNRSMATGIVLTVLGVVAYGVGTSVEYPGRAFSLTLLMVGITLVLVGRNQEAHPL